MDIGRDNLKKISDYVWEIPRAFRSDMRVSARIFASEKMLPEIFRDHSLWQLVNVATLPGIIGSAVAMPDVHEGYGFPVGGVAATEFPDGTISPGGIGYDINCGVRILLSDLSFPDAEGRLGELNKRLYREIPSGVGRGGNLRLDATELDRVLRCGARRMAERGCGEERDLENTESRGMLPDADPAAVSDQAKNRGRGQLGTIGAGNHFVQTDVVEKVFDEAAARAFGLSERQVVILIHTGSRGLGHQVATDHIRKMVDAMERYDIELPDRELASAPFSSPEGQAYFGAMAAAANFAWANRQAVAWEVRKAWEAVFGKERRLSTLYDIAHNIAKVEEHEIDGERRKAIVHRKGATRAFPPGSHEIPEAYRASGQPVVIPGSMGSASYVLAGTETAMERSFGSACHGAGRRLSRKGARREVRGKEVRRELMERGIYVETGSLSGLAEEAPFAYKDIHDVVDAVEGAGLARKVALLRPIAVIKG
jgi:tRNA-splicing ligase RtcB